MQDATARAHEEDADARFTAHVLARDGNKCVFCSSPAVSVHQLFAKELWDDGGFFAENGASVCQTHLHACRATEISVETVAAAIGISEPVLPEHLYSVQRYDTWGNPILQDGRRARGELFDLPAVQAELSRAGHLERFTHWSRYPRTYALPWSETIGEGDRQMRSTDAFVGERVVATEKMDGENISLYRDFLHSRSVRESHHPTRRWLNDYWSARRDRIPLGWRVCGEYLFARHTVEYENLESYFLGFAVWTDANECLSWDDTMEFFSSREITPVRILFDGAYEENVIRNIWSASGSASAEGYVLRVAGPFLQRDFRRCVGKFIRSGYAQSYPLRDGQSDALQLNGVRGASPVLSPPGCLESAG